MRLIRTPWPLIKLLYSSLFRFPETEKKIYLTFDDGPIPEATPFVLEELRKAGAKATFFCVGENVRKNEREFKAVLEAGHGVGIHTYNHLDGWKTPDALYLENIEKCRAENNSLLFRPPYGKISPSQYFKIKTRYRIVFWDVVSYDFDSSFSAEECYKACLGSVKAGSIVVFHDSLKSFTTLKEVLPRLLRHWKEEGYVFPVIPS